MSEIKPVRIDKFLWSVRIYKTRSIAADACRKGRILINELQVKPSHLIKTNEIITVRKLPVIFKYRILELVENRISAKLVPNYLEDLTPLDEKIKLENNKGFNIFRIKGSGRPTKKERRNLDEFIDRIDHL